MLHLEQEEAPVAGGASGGSKSNSTTEPMPPLYAPWHHDDIKFGFDGYVCGLPVAARSAREYARDVMELDAMHAGCDWAGILCARANASRAELECRLPMDADARVRAMALEGLT